MVIFKNQGIFNCLFVVQYFLDVTAVWLFHRICQKRRTHYAFLFAFRIEYPYNTLLFILELAMLLSVLAVIAGIIILTWSADRFVDGAAALARILGVSPLVIGLTIIGFGTSAPEMLISAIASLDHAPGLAVGNAIGSNIANIALVLGVSALVRPLLIQSGVIRREYPAMIIAMILATWLMRDGSLDGLDGAILLAALAAFLIITVRLALGKDQPAMVDVETDILGEEYAEEIPQTGTVGSSLFWVITGLALLLISSKLLVWGATNIAHAFGVSDLVIGLTIVAIGTSLPELAASVSATLKNEHDMAIGNIVGSNIFNMLGVLALPGVLGGVTISPDALNRDVPLMLGLAALMLVFARGRRARINRFEGALFVAIYIAYLLYLGYTASS